MPSGFKPSRQRCSRLFHDRTSRHGCLMTACCTDQPPPRLTPRLSRRLACRTAKTTWPPQFLQVGFTCSFIGERLNELPERVGEINPIGQIVPVSVLAILVMPDIIAQEELTDYPAFCNYPSMATYLTSDTEISRCNDSPLFLYSFLNSLRFREYP